MKMKLLGPLRLSASDHELLASIHGGQSDPIYAVVSRTVDHHPTWVSQEELEACIEGLREFAELDPDEDEANKMRDLADFLSGYPVER